MVLLTPATISAAISSGVVFLFGFALFLSGYVMQQKTVNSIRQQIREPPRPKHTYVYLPEKFVTPTPSPELDQEISVIINTDTSDQGLLEAEVNGGDNGLAAVDTGGRQVDGSGGRVIAVEVGSQIPVGEPVVEAVQQSGDVQAKEDPARSLEGLSRAERRRRIKEDIEESTRADREGYHRRTY